MGLETHTHNLTFKKENSLAPPLQVIKIYFNLEKNIYDKAMSCAQGEAMFRSLFSYKSQVQALYI